MVSKIGYLSVILLLLLGSVGLALGKTELPTQVVNYSFYIFVATIFIDCVIKKDEK